MPWPVASLRGTVLDEVIYQECLILPLSLFHMAVSLLVQLQMCKNKLMSNVETQGACKSKKVSGQWFWFLAG